MERPAFEKRLLRRYPKIPIAGAILLLLFLLTRGNIHASDNVPVLPKYCETAGEISVLLSEDKRTLQVDAEVFCVSSPIIAAYLQIATDEGLFKASIDLTSDAEANKIHASVDPRSFITELMTGKVYLEILTLNDVDGKFIGKLGATEVLVVSSTELYSVNLLEQRNIDGLNLPIELRLNTMDNYISPILILEESDSFYLRMAPTEPSRKKAPSSGSSELEY